MKPLPKLIASLLFLALVCAWAFFVNACSKHEAQLSTGRVIAAADLPGLKGDAAYAEVNPDCLPSLYEDFRAELSARGLVRWDARYDCNKFASHYISRAQTRYSIAAWHSSTPAQSLALAEVWFERPDGTRHAIVQARTPAGDIYIEPQTGQRTTAGQIYLRKW